MRTCERVPRCSVGYTLVEGGCAGLAGGSSVHLVVIGGVRESEVLEHVIVGGEGRGRRIALEHLRASAHTKYLLDGYLDRMDHKLFTCSTLLQFYKSFFLANHNSLKTV